MEGSDSVRQQTYTPWRQWRQYELDRDGRGDQVMGGHRQPRSGDPRMLTLHEPFIRLCWVDIHRPQREAADSDGNFRRN